jgi:predicted AAA+ superfamily ATPase
MKKRIIKYVDSDREITVNYIPRLIDSQIQNELKSFSAVLLRGPKWCGKTTTAAALTKSWIFLSRKAMKETYDGYLVRPQLFLEGAKPRLLDEWQTYPILWDLVKDESDIVNKPGLFVLTGSYSPKPGSTNHTGSMRIQRLRMTTMTLYEKGLSTGEASLSAMLRGEDIRGQNTLSFEQITDLMVEGGFPASLERPSQDKNAFGKAALNSICETDIQEATGKKLRPQVTRAILRSLARAISQYPTNATIIEDIGQSEAISEPTFYEYYDGLLRLSVIQEIEAFSPAIRSRDNLRMAPKREFSDVSVAIAALGLSPDDLNNDPHTRGFFFENFVGHDLEVYADHIGAKLGQYHDKQGLEIDFTIHFSNGDYGLIEVKQGESELPQAFKTLNAFDSLVEAYNLKHSNSPMRKPAFKLVVTGDSPYALKRENGIYVAPISLLGF